MNVLVLRIVLILSMPVAIVSPAWAYNLVANPSFSGGTGGWTTDPSTIFDGANDATGMAGSGSAKSTFHASTAGVISALSQCIASGPGNYTFGGKVLIPSGQPVTGFGSIVVFFFSGPDCTTGFLSNRLLITGATGSFQTLSGGFIAPPGTTHIWISGQNAANAVGDHVVNFDDFVLDNGLSSAAVPAPTLGWFGLLALFATISTSGVLLALYKLKRRTDG